MRVSRLPRDPGPAGWNAILDPALDARVLEDATTADWLVIGAGFAGLSAARRLALLHPRDRIVVLEASRVAAGPAGRNSGFMIDLPHDLSSESYTGALESDHAETRFNREAIAFAAEMADDFGLPQEAFAASGKINAAATEKGHAHNLDYARHLDRMSEPKEMLDAAQMQSLTGTSYYKSGLFTPGTVMLQPALYIRGIAAGLTSNRGSIFEDSPVIELRRNGRSWEALTGKGQVTAPKVILAVNGHANSFGHFRNRLMHVFTYASMTRALNKAEISRLGGADHWGVTPADPLGTTVRKISGIGGTRIVVRNRFTYEPSLEVSAASLARIAKSHRAAFEARFPILRDVEMEHVWGGRLCLSRNNVHAFGEIDDGLYSACCQNGLGTTKGTMTGLAAADLASGIETPMTRFLQDMDAPSALLPGPVMKIGAALRLKLGERRAGREL